MTKRPLFPMRRLGAVVLRWSAAVSRKSLKSFVRRLGAVVLGAVVCGGVAQVIEIIRAAVLRRSYGCVPPYPPIPPHPFGVVRRRNESSVGGGEKFAAQRLRTVPPSGKCVRCPRSPENRET